MNGGIHLFVSAVRRLVVMPRTRRLLRQQPSSTISGAARVADMVSTVPPSTDKLALEGEGKS